MIIQPKIRGFICTTAHPAGCASHVQQQIDYVNSQPKVENGPKNVLIVGASMGYGMASRIVSAFSAGANTLGVFFEKPGTGTRSGSAGWYNTAAFEKAAMAEGLIAKSLNGDAFSHELKQQAVDVIRNDMGGKIDLVIYSLASPRRTDPDTGETYTSVLKTTDGTYSNKTLNTDLGEVGEITIGAATQEEIDHTVKVMGGEDWELWIDALAKADVLAEGVKTVAYSYIGPELTWPIYKNGTIGRAKEALETSCNKLNHFLAEKLDGSAVISVKKALVTQSSSAIPVVPLYISILYKIMKAKGIHEKSINQCQRLFTDHLYKEDSPLDEKGRIRVDDWEMREDVQAEVIEAWENITTENLTELADFAGYQKAFLRIFGFGLPDVDYTLESDPTTAPPSLS
ncbi:MAG: trans-2-enoyl-CoA reductase family protein [Verrucomicrobiae bacterium]|nr:trans-2-enoyl-CoA reductase family protein [Verrucomicrobiae bacterium]NNJ87231.1 trans-2-enoyl-CoA reductase family protein [Akkermansiaceae bacterium]